MITMRRALSPLFAVLLIILACLSWMSLLPGRAQDADMGSACPGSLPSRLAVGGVGRVLPGDPNNVRVDPTTDAPRIGQIKAGETFTIEDGPVCADGYTWWQVDLRGLVGWTPEADDGVYWVEMITAPEPVIAEGDCPGSLPTRLAIGDQVRVRPTKANNVRVNPSVNAEVLYKLPVGGSAILLNGPVCADGYTWWQIEDLGWTAESGDGDYWLEGFNASPTVLSPAATATPNTALALLTPSATLAATDSAPAPSLPAGLSVDTLWTETFDDNSAGWKEIPFEGYTDEYLFREIKDGGYTMSRTHSHSLMQDWDGKFLQEIEGLPDSLDQYVLSVDVQSLSPESQSQCAVLQVNLEVTEQAILFFCRGGLVSGGWLGNQTQQQGTEGRVLTSLPDVMDGEIHHLTVISDGQTLSTYIDGQAGLTFAYAFPLNSFGLSYYDFDQNSTINLTIRFDTVEIGVPTFTVTPTPSLVPTKAPTKIALGPHPTSSAEALFQQDVPSNTVPSVYSLIQRIPSRQDSFDDNDAGWQLSTGPELVREIKEGRYVMSSTAGGPTEDSDVLVWPSSLDRRQFMVSVDVQNLNPNSSAACALLLVNMDSSAEPMSISYCRPGFISVFGDPYEQRFDEATKTNILQPAVVPDLPDAMDGAVHRLSVVLDGHTLRVYIDGQGSREFTYTETLFSVGMGYADFDDDPQTAPSVAFDNFDVSLPTTCTLTVVVTPLEMVVTQQSSPTTPLESSITFTYGYYQDWTSDSGISDSTTLTDLQLQAGDHVTGFPPLERTVGCSRETATFFTVDEQGEFVDHYIVKLSENAWREVPRDGVVTFASRSGLIYSLTYHVEVKSAGDTPLPLVDADLSGITVKPGDR